MSRKCSISGTKQLSGNKRSHALNSTKRKWNVNTQKVIIKIDGIKRSLKISTRTLRTLKKKGKI